MKIQLLILNIIKAAAVTLITICIIALISNIIINPDAFNVLK